MAGHVYAPDATVSSDDLDSIAQVARDYWEAWYSGDAGRMERCLHPDLDKRALVRRLLDTRTEYIASDLTTRSAMVALTESGLGLSEHEEPPVEITVLAAFHHLASVRADGEGMTDLLHLMKFPEGWRIVHAVWTLHGGVIANATYDA